MLVYKFLNRPVWNFTFTLELFIDHLKFFTILKISDIDLDLQSQIAFELQIFIFLF